MRKLLLLITLGAASALALVATASATPPERFSFSGSASDPHFLQCDGFEVSGVFTDSVEGTVFFDAAGEVVRLTVYIRAEDVLTNSVTGKTIVNHGVFHLIFERIGDTDEFTQTIVGHIFLATSPGEGIVLHDAGRIVLSPNEEDILFQAGHHIMEDEFDDLACAALA